MKLSLSKYDGSHVGIGGVVKAIFSPQAFTPNLLARNAANAAESTGKAHRPPIEPNGAAASVTMSTKVQAISLKMARLSVGLGAGFVQRFPEMKLSDEAQGQLRTMQWWMNCKLRMLRTGGRAFYQNYEGAMRDRWVAGNGYTEFNRSTTRTITKAVFARGIEMRRRTGAQGGFMRFVPDERGAKVTTIYFADFGDDIIYSRADGTPIGRWEFDEKAGQWCANVKGVPQEEWASEVTHRFDPHPLSSHYGIPWWLPARYSVANNFDIGENVSFYITNQGNYRFAVAVENGRLDPKTKAYLDKYLSEGGKAINDAGGGILHLQAESKVGGLGGDIRIRITPLGPTDDPSFGVPLKQGNEEIRQASALSDLFTGSGEALSRGAATFAKQMGLEHEILPENKAESEFFDEVVFNEWYEEFYRSDVARQVKMDKGALDGMHLVAFRFDRPSLMDPSQRSQILMRAGVRDNITPDQAAAVAGSLLGDGLIVPQGKWWGKIPVGIQGLLLSSVLGVAKDVGGAAAFRDAYDAIVNQGADPMEFLNTLEEPPAEEDPPS